MKRRPLDGAAGEVLCSASVAMEASSHGSGNPGGRIMMRAWGELRPLSFDARGDGVPLINSALHAWPGVPFELHRTQPTDEPWDSGPLEGEAHLRVVLDGGFDVTVRAAQRELLWHVGPGSLTLHVRSGTVLRVAGSAQVFALGLSRSWLQRLLPEVAPDALREYAAPAPDPSARAIAQAMCEAVAHAEPCSALFAESASLALLCRVLERLPRHDRSPGTGAATAGSRRPYAGGCASTSMRACRTIFPWSRSRRCAGYGRASSGRCSRARSARPRTATCCSAGSRSARACSARASSRSRTWRSAPVSAARATSPPPSGAATA